MFNYKQVLAGHKRREAGRSFEAALILQARMQRILVKKFPLGGERRGRKFIQIKTECDFNLINEQGTSVYIDTKSINENTFPFALLKTHQLNGLKEYWDYKCNAGYLILFRKSNSVVFFPVPILLKLRPGEGLNPLMGQYMGTEENMALGNLFL